jgi:hypothetical protein
MMIQMDLQEKQGEEKFWGHGDVQRMVGNWKVGNLDCPEKCLGDAKIFGRYPLGRYELGT